MADVPPASPPAKKSVSRWVVVLIVILLIGLAKVAYFGWRFTRDEPVRYADLEEHFKYGSTGGERESGIPYWIWKVLPKMFPEYLPGEKYEPGREYASMGFLYEDGKDLPVGVSQRNTQGINRVFLNCAICHVGSVREAPGKPRALFTGMPSNTVDLGAFERFIFACAMDQRFTADRILPEIKAIGGDYDFLNRAILRVYAFPLIRERLLMLAGHFRYLDWEPDQGPGRTDTFTPAKTLLEFPLEKMQTKELVGLCDFPSIWLQGQRKEMKLRAHWDDNNSMMEERNKSAAFGTGTFPPTIDLKLLGRVEEFILTKQPPPYPFAIDQQRVAQGAPIYAQYCASCHGRNGRKSSIADTTFTIRQRWGSSPRPSISMPTARVAMTPETRTAISGSKHSRGRKAPRPRSQ